MPFYFVDRGDSYKPNKHLNHLIHNPSDGFTNLGSTVSVEDISNWLAPDNIVGYDNTFTTT